MIAFVNLFLIGFAFDAAISMLDDLTRFGLEPTPITTLRVGVAYAVLVGAAANFFLLALQPRLPKRILLPLIAFLTWHALGAYPLSFAPSLALSSIQIGFAFAAFGWVRARSATRHWLLHTNDLPNKRPRWGYTLRFATATALIAPPILVGTLALSLSEQIENVTGGFMTFDLEGINSTAREYRREGRRIDLVGMAHIGDDDAYLNLFESFTGESTILLEEGVTDEGGRMGDGLLYEAIAGRIGLDVQPSFESLSQEMYDDGAGTALPDIRNADVDSSVFSEETIAVLGAASKLYESDRLAPALKEFRAALDELGPEATQAAFRDLIDNRNAHLIEEIQASLDDYERIVVPWGALHLPQVEEAILGWGFEHTATSQRRITAYQTILAALLSRDETRESATRR